MSVLTDFNNEIYEDVYLNDRLTELSRLISNYSNIYTANTEPHGKFN